MPSFISFALIAVLATVQFAWADRTQEIEQQLRRFQRSPRKVMNERIQKQNVQGTPSAQRAQNAPTKRDIKTGKFTQKRDELRMQKACSEETGSRVCLKDILDIDPGRAAIAGNDRAENLVDNGAGPVNKDVKDYEKLPVAQRPFFSNLAKMNDKLRAAKLDETPWSDDYWGIYKGVLGARYSDGSFPADQDWKVNKTWITAPAHAFASIFTSRIASSIDDLSPAEKFDLLVGDKSGSLANDGWSEGEGYYRSSGKVEPWMGICHGWAPAAYMLMRPTKPITAIAADGTTKIRFYPADIKALGSLLWAKGESPNKFIGGRCNTKAPKQDPKNGRVMDQACFDTNPGAWHMAVVNQLGVSRRSMVIDATYDYEVWNQPMHAYEYTYFNPETGKETADLAKATVDAGFKNDKFAANRKNPKAKKIVGIAMDVTYVVETQPVHRDLDSPSLDATRSARYMYDLELDADGNIVGGEWYTNTHPDFLWTPPLGAQAMSGHEGSATGTWNVKTALPASWASAAQRAAKNGQPLGKIVEALVTEARIAR